MLSCLQVPFQSHIMQQHGAEASDLKPNAFYWEEKKKKFLIFKKNPPNSEFINYSEQCRRGLEGIRVPLLLFEPPQSRVRTWKPHQHRIILISIVSYRSFCLCLTWVN